MAQLLVTEFNCNQCDLRYNHPGSGDLAARQSALVELMNTIMFEHQLMPFALHYFLLLPLLFLQTAIAHLDEANVVGVLPEALTADVQVVLADDTALVAAHTAASTTAAMRICQHTHNPLGLLLS